MTDADPHFSTTIALLQIPRWDYAFSFAWAATKSAKGMKHFASDKAAFAVRDNSDREAGRRFILKAIAALERLKHADLVLSWQMIAADPAQPDTVLSFVPQLGYIVAIGDEGREPQQRAVLGGALAVWFDAADGRYKDSKLSLFARQAAAPERMQSSFRALAHAAALENHRREADVRARPGMIVVPSETAGKLTSETSVYQSLIGSRLNFALAPPLAPVRAALVAEYPHAAAAVDLMLRDLREGQPARMNPMVLTGPPGTGKSRIVRRLGELLGVKVHRFDASGIIDSLSWTGSARAWGNSTPSIPVRAIHQTRLPNPIVLIDEIEKAVIERGGRNGNLMNALTPYLERETAARYRDLSLDAVADLSFISYVATANGDEYLPDHIKDRFRVVRVPLPKLEHLPALARNVLVDLAQEQGIDSRFAETPQEDELAVIGKAWARQKFSIRALQKIVSATLDARAAFAPRH